MLAGTHLLFTLFLISILRTSTTDIGFVIVALIATLLPDIDTPKSTLGRIVPWFGAMFKHRGFMHTIATGVLLSIGLWMLLPPSIGVAIILGYFSHLFMDAISKEGIMPLYPFSRKKLRGPIRVGSVSEGIVAATILLITLTSLY